jgi:peptide/nickel transport system permease protein
MTRYAVGRLAQAIPLLVLVTVIAFGILHLAPGDPAVLLYGADLSSEQLAQIRANWGLDESLPVQYLKWLGNLARGDLGRSFVDGRPALEVVLERIPATLELTITGLAVAIIVGVSVGSLAALRPHSPLGYLATVAALGLLLILVFSVLLGWLPSAGIESLRGSAGPFDRLLHLLMPAFVISLREMGRLIRFTRASLLDVLGQDYVRTAWAKGLTLTHVTRDHALRNALIPIITLLGLSVPQVLSSSIVVETVFAWPGMGRLLVESAFQRNYTVLMAEIVLVSVLVVLGNLLADVAYAAADPRIRYEE